LWPEVVSGVDGQIETAVRRLGEDFGIDRVVDAR
jgi:hypothetical protein